MRVSEFWDLISDEFGRTQGQNLVRELVLFELGNRTAEQALAAGVPVREVWVAMCDALDVPQARRWGRDKPAS